mmetsp:Transcript_28277/g.53352  ORF Transcript_28277/g.53352 Transcript_28277/m.53352 type:complete len:434 (-) Transcript_28277:123-1424(-)
MNFNFYPPSYDQVVHDMATAAAASNNSAWPTNYSPQQQQYQQQHQQLHQHQQQHHQQQQYQDGGDANARLCVERECEGCCSDCGAETHKLLYKTAEMMSSRGGLFSSASATVVHKEPLTVHKKVYRGRCLLCHPFTVFPGSASGNPHQQQGQQIHSITHEDEPPIPQEIAVKTNDSNDHEEVENDDEEILEILCRMRINPHDLPIHISSFHSLWVLSWETENAIAIGRLGGIPVILESLRYHLVAHLNINNRYNRDHHTNSPSVVRQMQLQSNGLATIQNLSSVNGYNKELLVGISDSEQHGGGISLLLLSMSTFIQNAEIQRSGCNALANLLSSNSEGNCYKFNILSSGGLDVVSTIVEVHKGNEGVVRGAYKCLCLLGQNPSWKELAPILTDQEDLENEHDVSAAADGGASMFDDKGGGAQSSQSSRLKER